jgi:hypothetical protein
VLARIISNLPEAEICNLGQNTDYAVGSEALTAEVMKSSVAWDIMPCGPLRVNRRF